MRDTPLDIAGAIQMAQDAAYQLAGAVASVPDPANDPTPPASGRADYDQNFRIKGLEPGEPYLFIRARDTEATAMAEIYAALIARAGADPAMVESALQLRDAVAAWPEKRLVNADHLTEAQKKQLRYLLTRRAMRASADLEDVRVVLAEERATYAVFARLRPLLAALFDGGRWNEDGTWTFDPRSLTARDDPKIPPPARPDPIAGLQDFHRRLGRGEHG